MSDRELIVVSAAIARRAPEEWSDFLAAFKSYTDTRRDQCVSSPVDTLQVTQGRAQQCVSLLRLLEDCVRTADQIAEKRK
jgi:hypothetical protein